MRGSGSVFGIRIQDAPEYESGSTTLVSIRNPEYIVPVRRTIRNSEPYLDSEALIWVEEPVLYWSAPPPGVKMTICKWQLFFNS